MLLSHTELNGAFVSHYMQHVVIVFGRDSYIFGIHYSMTNWELAIIDSVSAGSTSLCLSV